MPSGLEKVYIRSLKEGDFVSIKGNYKKIRYAVRDVVYNRKNRKRLSNDNFSLITCDCTGGCVAKDLKVRMNSPTRNFYFNADDYIKFCKNLDYYLSLVPEPYTGNYSGGGSEYLMASLGDLKMFLVHYPSVEQCQQEWLRRRDRVNKNNMFFVMNDRNYCTEEDIKMFDNKVCFTHKKYPQYKSTYYISGSENDNYLKSVMDYVHQWWIIRYYDQFDFVTWLNNGGSDWRQL